MAILAIVGPTGVGKSDVAVELAHRIPAEVVCVDSMQVYRGLEIGTGKPSRAVRAEIPHHGLDLAEPEEEFNAARYAELVRPVVAGVQRRGRLPVLAGGSGFYFRGLLDGLCEAPGQSPLLRERLLMEGKEVGSPRLHERLSGVDPQAAARIHPNDLRRIIRALEVYEVTGRPFSEWHKKGVRGSMKGEMVCRVGLTCERQSLYAAIGERVQRWLSAGWLEEGRQLHARRLSRTAREALGYKELFEFIEGKADWSGVPEKIRRNTCRYAKRQWSWFRADPRIEWLGADGKGPGEIAGEILRRWNGRF